MRTSLSNTIRRVSLESDEMQQDVALPLEASVAEAQGPEEWIVDTHQPLDEVRDSATLSGQLEDLTEVVEDAPLEASVESYHWMLNTLIQNAGMPTTRGVALENFTHSSGGKKLLASSIRNYNSNLKRSINIALENYTDGYASTLSDVVSKYNEVNSSLEKELNALSSKKVKEVVKVDHKNIWKLFHVDGKFLESETDLILAANDISSIFKLCTGLIDDITATLKKSTEENPATFDHITLPNKTYNLLSNQRFEVDRKGVHVTELRTPAPKPAYTAGDIGWIVGWSIIFSWVGLVLSLWLKKKTGFDTKKKRSSNEIKATLSNFVNIKKDVVKLNAAVEELAKALKADKTNVSSDAKRAAAPVLELSSAILSHATTCSYGFSTLIRQMY